MLGGRDREASNPFFCLHKDTEQGYVELNGQRIYLGRYDLPETLRKYHQILAEFRANDHQLPVDPHYITISELMACYNSHAGAYYRHADGTPKIAM